MSSTITPKALTPLIQSFCEDISSAQVPVYLQVRPPENARQAECYSNVDMCIAQHGGSKLHGWQIWEWPGVLIEAEFHAVWVNGEGELIDVTPKPDDDERIMFLPDPARSYQGNRINNIRKPLSASAVVADFLELCDLDHLLYGQVRMVRSDSFHFQIGQAKQLLIDVIQNGGNRNGKCACGSSDRYKHCHEPAAKQLIEHLRNQSVMTAL